jgi:hypothetical protein
MNTIQERIQVLAKYGLNKSEIDELLAYNYNNFHTLNWKQIQQFPLGDESHIALWQEYAAESQSKETYETLKQYLIQLQFPIAPGISDRPEYQAATRRGVDPKELQLATGLPLQAPEKLQLWIHQTIAGKIPVIVAGDRADFITLVQALTKKNEPQPIPEAMGACIVGGYNNWHRLQRYRQQWQGANPWGNWQQEFKKIIPQKNLYQDRFIILSQGNYSGVSAAQLGLAKELWQDLSLKIRLEHECTHYMTRRLLNSMQNNLLDELIADYQGIVAAWGSYRSDWCLYFLGLESSTYRQGGRLENYRGEPPLSDKTFQVLQRLVRQAAQNLANFDRQYYQERDRNPLHKLAVFIALTRSNLEELTSTTAVKQLLARTQEEFDFLNRNEITAY